MAFVLHVLFSMTNTMYMPFAAFYYVQRVHTMCSVNFTCQYLTIFDYLTSDIIVMAIGAMVHCPIYFVTLIFLDVRKSGGSYKDFVNNIMVSWSSKI